MNFLKTIARVHPKSLLRLMGLGLGHPLLLWPTFMATKECLRISTVHFGRLHYQNTPANAFRHALWNYLIAQRCRRYSRTDDAALHWARTITDWHENAFKNEEMARTMDFHNNAVGRNLFKKQKKRSKEAVIALFLQLAKESVKMTRDTVLQDHKNAFVHLID